MARNVAGITVAYLTSLVSFVQRLERHQKKAQEAAQGLPEFRGVSITIDSGNKYDKVLRSVSRARPANPAKTAVKTEVLYFVEKETGEIFGARSEIAPNLNRFCGLVQNANKWDWSGEVAVNVSDDSVEEVGSGYGDVKHYAPVKVSKKASAAPAVVEEVAAVLEAASA